MEENKIRIATHVIKAKTKKSEKKKIQMDYILSVNKEKLKS